MRHISQKKYTNPIFAFDALCSYLSGCQKRVLTFSSSCPIYFATKRRENKGIESRPQPWFLAKNLLLPFMPIHLYSNTQKGVSRQSICQTKKDLQFFFFPYRQKWQGFLSPGIPFFSWIKKYGETTSVILFLFVRKFARNLSCHLCTKVSRTKGFFRYSKAYFLTMLLKKGIWTDKTAKKSSYGFRAKKWLGRFFEP